MVPTEIMLTSIKYFLWVAWICWCLQGTGLNTLKLTRPMPLTCFLITSSTCFKLDCFDCPQRRSVSIFWDALLMHMVQSNFWMKIGGTVYYVMAIPYLAIVYRFTFTNITKGFSTHYLTRYAVVNAYIHNQRQTYGNRKLGYILNVQIYKKNIYELVVIICLAWSSLILQQ